jgi:hypothetical protein
MVAAVAQTALLHGHGCCKLFGTRTESRCKDMRT